MKRNELYMSELTRLLEEMGRFFKLFSEEQDKELETLTINNLKMLKNMANTEYDIISKFSSKASKEEKEEIGKILSGIKEFVAVTDANSFEKMIETYKFLTDIKAIHEQEKVKSNMLQKVFQSDLEEMKLHEDKLKTLQEIVDFDLKEYGKVTDTTLEVLSVQHCTLKENKVEETIEKEKEEPKKEVNHSRNQSNIASNKKEEKGKPKPLAGNIEKSYQGSAYLKENGKKQTPIILYGNSPEDIIARLQGWNMTRTEDMKLASCYIRKLNSATNKYENTEKYDVITGVDITPIYLNLPHMGRNEYLKLVAEIKKNGAKYNPQKKAFYITKQNDLNKFSKYLPITGTHSEQGENRSQNELSYEIEAGQEYYDNRVTVTIEGMEPINVYGDDHGVHFPSLSAEQTREIVDKFVLPSIDTKKITKELPAEIEYDGKKYNPLQYEVLLMAEKQNINPEMMLLLKHPELSSDRMNEIRFAIKDGLSTDQIKQFATPDHEQWQMDFCRIGMQHGLTYEELQDIINPNGYSGKDWGKRRSMLGDLIKQKEQQIGREAPNLTNTEAKNEIGKDSVVFKLNQNKSKIEALNSERKENIQYKETHRER